MERKRANIVGYITVSVGFSFSHCDVCKQARNPETHTADPDGQLKGTVIRECDKVMQVF
jgi:hypothetical protein